MSVIPKKCGSFTPNDVFHVFTGDGANNRKVIGVDDIGDKDAVFAYLDGEVGDRMAPRSFYTISNVTVTIGKAGQDSAYLKLAARSNTMITPMQIPAHSNPLLYAKEFQEVDTIQAIQRNNEMGYLVNCLKYSKKHRLRIA